MLDRLKYALAEHVLLPVLMGTTRVLARFGRLPRAHGIKFVSCVGDLEPLREQVVAALHLIEQVDPEHYREGCQRWRLLMVRPLPDHLGARWLRQAATLEIGERLARTGHVAHLAVILAEQAAVVRLWRAQRPRTAVEADALRPQAKAYAEWFAAQLPPAMVQEAIGAGAS